MSYTIWPDGLSGEVVRDIFDERRRQEHLREQGKFSRTCATRSSAEVVALTNPESLAVLAEEFGEVSRHVTEEIIDPVRLDRMKLRKELIEVAAVAAAWAERLS